MLFFYLNVFIKINNLCIYLHMFYLQYCFTHNIFHTYEKIDTEEVPEKVKKTNKFLYLQNTITFNLIHIIQNNIFILNLIMKC